MLAQDAASALSGLPVPGRAVRHFWGFRVDIAKYMHTILDMLMNLQKYRQGAGLSREQLSRKAGVAASTIAQIETRDVGCRVETARRLALALDVSLEELIGVKLK